MNARRHGLRARTFGILPEEDQAEWARHLEELRAGYGPADDTEQKLVEAIAAAMWNEIRADRTLAEVMAAIPPLAPGRPHGGDLQEPRHALSLNTAIRYMTAASMATQARPARLPRPPQGQARRPASCRRPQPRPSAANENRTNETTAAAGSTEMHERIAGPSAASPPPVRTRWQPCAPGSTGCSTGPGRGRTQEWDLVAAIRAVKLPGGCALPRPDRPCAAGAGPGRAGLRRRRPRLARRISAQGLGMTGHRPINVSFAALWPLSRGGLLHLHRLG